MGQVKEMSKKNPFWISKEHKLELIHFCRQYPEWQREYKTLCEAYPEKRQEFVRAYRANIHVADEIIEKLEAVTYKMDLIDRTLLLVAGRSSKWLRLSVIEGYTYEQMTALHGPLPLSRPLFYKRLQEFYFELAKKR